MMLFPAFIASRLSLRRDSNGENRRSAGTVIAIVGIALAIAIMLLSTSIVTGFKQEIRNRVTGFNAPITIYPIEAFSDTTASQGIRLDDDLADIIRQSSPATTPVLAISQSAIFKTDTDFLGVVLKSCDKEFSDSFLSRHIARGSGEIADSAANSVIISLKMANMLQLDIDSSITVHFLRDNQLTTRKLNITGIYNSHFSEYDELYAFTSMAFLRKLNRLDSVTGSTIELRNLSVEQVPEIANTLELNLLTESLEKHGRREYAVSNVLNTSALYFNWLDLLDTNVVVIIVLMTLVAAFTLISSLFIIILERVGMIGLLKSLGADNSQIRRVFILLAQRLVLRGLLWGNIVGITIMAVQYFTHLMPLDPESYYLDYVPIAFNLFSILAINIGAIIVSFAVLILPSQFIARLSPAETMRFE